MANIELLAPIVLQWEGKTYTDSPSDRGGPTKMGITLSAWKSQGYDKDGDGDIDEDDVKLLTMADFTFILKSRWDRWQADKIVNQSIANLLVDWVYCSGKWGIILPQRLLFVKDDGLVGRYTISAVNNQAFLHKMILDARRDFLYNIVCNDKSQNKWLNGWMNRLKSFPFIK